MIINLLRNFLQAQIDRLIRQAGKHLSYYTAMSLSAVVAVTCNVGEAVVLLEQHWLIHTQVLLFRSGAHLLAQAHSTKTLQQATHTSEGGMWLPWTLPWTLPWRILCEAAVA